MGAIDKILEERKQSATPASEDAKFYSILLGEGIQEHFLEFQFRIGMKTCFKYDQLNWFNFDPESGRIDLDFAGYLVSLKGRGLGTKLFHGIKQKRVAWIKEADTEFQDNKENETYIEEILISPPEEAVSESE